MIVDSYIPQFAFSSSFHEIVLGTVLSDVTFVLSRIDESGEYVEVLKEVYAPDTDRKVYILGLSDIIAANLFAVTSTKYRFSFKNKENSLVYESKILLSRAFINISAEIFTKKHFLSLMQGDRTLHISSSQYLRMYVNEPETVRYAARYRDREGNYINDSGRLDDITVTDRIVGMTVSPLEFAKPDCTLVKLAVIAGERIATFLIDSYSRPAKLNLVFENNFGMPECYAVMGSLDYENKYTNELGYIKGKFKKYHVETLKEYTVNTGVLDQQTADWIEDLYNSEFVFFTKSEDHREEITITDVIVKRSSSPSELPSHEFKYRISQRNQILADFKTKTPRIFDDSFDYTFR